MRRLTLLLLAALLALSASALHMTAAKPVHADGACGIPTDFDGVTYPDGYWGGPGYPGGSIWVTGGDGHQHELAIDLAAWRLTVGNGNCYRGFYVSTWFPDGSYGYQRPRVDAYTGYNCPGCTRGPWTFLHGSPWWPGNATWTGPPGAGVTCETCGTWGPWGSYTYAVTLPNGANVLMDFGISTGYGRRANSYFSHVYDACVGGCNFDVLSSPGGWYVQIWQ